MTFHPQSPTASERAVDDDVIHQHRCGRVNPPTTWGFTSLSPVHNPYYDDCLVLIQSSKR